MCKGRRYETAVCVERRTSLGVTGRHSGREAERQAPPACPSPMPRKELELCPSDDREPVKVLEVTWADVGD